MKKIKNKSGTTIPELIVSMAIVLIFFISLTELLAVGSKVHLKQTAMGNTEVVIETLADDIKGYTMYGTDIRVMYVLSDGKKEVAGTDLSIYPDGTEVYLDPDATDLTTASGFCLNPTTGDVVEVALLDPASFYGNGVDLGFKKIYLTKNAEGVSYIKGLAYGSSYYRKLGLDLQIRDKSDYTLPLDPKKQGIYEINLTGQNSTGYLKVKSHVAVTGVNKQHELD